VALEAADNLTVSRGREEAPTKDAEYPRGFPIEETPKAAVDGNKTETAVVTNKTNKLLRRRGAMFCLYNKRFPAVYLYTPMNNRRLNFDNRWMGTGVAEGSKNTSFFPKSNLTSIRNVRERNLAFKNTVTNLKQKRYEVLGV
jgi:hypothetical protein